MKKWDEKEGEEWRKVKGKGKEEETRGRARGNTCGYANVNYINIFLSFPRSCLTARRRGQVRGVKGGGMGQVATATLLPLPHLYISHKKTSTITLLAGNQYFRNAQIAVMWPVAEVKVRLLLKLFTLTMGIERRVRAIRCGYEKFKYCIWQCEQRLGGYGRQLWKV